jgi:hypothetical protein
MNDVRDPKIRALVWELIEASPLAPDLPQISSRRHARRRSSRTWRLAAAVSIVLLVTTAIAVVGVWSFRGPDDRNGDVSIAANPGDHVLGDLPFVEDRGAVTARVVGGAPGRSELTVQIDAGSNSGVQVDQAVVTGAGLVGKVEDVSDSQASVALLRDSASSVRVRLSNGATGFVEGQGARKSLRLSDIDGSVEVQQGDLVTTAGDALSVFPGGVPVGRVQSVVHTSGALEQEILVRPVVRFERLRLVKALPRIRSRQDVRVVVLNASDVPNVALLKTNVLRGLGYDLAPPIDDAPRQSGLTIACHAGFDAEAERLAMDDRSVPDAEIVRFENPPPPGADDADCVMTMGAAP